MFNLTPEKATLLKNVATNILVAIIALALIILCCLADNVML